jgi:hypothetical protein
VIWKLGWQSTHCEAGYDGVFSQTALRGARRGVARQGRARRGGAGQGTAGQGKAGYFLEPFWRFGVIANAFTDYRIDRPWSR